MFISIYNYIFTDAKFIRRNIFNYSKIHRNRMNHSSRCMTAIFRIKHTFFFFDNNTSITNANCWKIYSMRNSSMI